MNLNLYDIKTIKGLMAAHGIVFRKEFGQNFLTNPCVTEDIADNCCDGASRTILEIGPGIGTLTRELAGRYENVVAVEIDRGLIPLLSYTLSDFDNIKVVNADVMKISLHELLTPYLELGPVSVCANLPYYITTPVLMLLLESGIPFDYITIMIQSEVANRLCASAGTSDYGAITAVLAYYGTAEKLFTVPAHNFIPEPKVNSTVVRIKLYKEKIYKPDNEQILFRTIRAAFEQRRKTLPNSLSAGFPEFSKEDLTKAITECGHSSDIRGERLDIAQFTELSNVINRLPKRSADN
ncbi:MAG: 16S rRNA (adenine(1518)-N(6)/adenine(1519)-N(6))-dimethyltransferase RsmA [Clostridia bacterium]|nr:16S rRNA (adenine(1518)-N(6)/adenine(1519)-N(6))-dimethyltransferase RsmA [Clostridia bacterium]MDY3785652.1 16S rRNA (adenine(1518)-N(6)/adenine(1519)-N(6))-dimethyltransferase RsmA [Eubacteriales bacterium]